MTRFAIDAPTALRIVLEGVEVAPGHQLVAPNSLRAETMSLLYRAVRAGEVDEAEVPALLDRITELRVRLLGDRVSRGTAWKLASRLDWADTAGADSVAVAVLQADALVTVDPRLISAAADVVDVAPFEALSRP